MKDIKDYLHFYIGCDVLRPDGKTVLQIYGIEGSLVVHRENSELTYSRMTGCKPILRPLADMTEEEIKERGWSKLELNHAVSQERNRSLYTNEFLYLLSRGFDLFNLISEGLAINKTESK